MTPIVIEPSGIRVVHCASFMIVSKKHGPNMVLVDWQDYDRVRSAGSTWCITKREHTTYVIRNSYHGGVKGPMQFLHHFILGTKGIDHVNGNGLDNRRENLRVATHAQNSQNLGPKRNNTSGYRGVYYDRANAKWVARVEIDGRSMHLGRFVDVAEAGRVAREARAKLMTFVNESRWPGGPRTK